MVGLERQRGAGRGGDLLLGLGNRWIGQAQERRFDQRGDDEHIHRAVRREAGGADALGKAHPAEHFHGAGIAALHLGQELRRLLLLDQHARDAAHAEINRERQPDGTGADNEDLGVDHDDPETRGCTGFSGRRREWLSVRRRIRLWVRDLSSQRARRFNPLREQAQLERRAQ